MAAQRLDIIAMFSEAVVVAGISSDLSQCRVSVQCPGHKDCQCDDITITHRHRQTHPIPPKIPESSQDYHCTSSHGSCAPLYICEHAQTEYPVCRKAGFKHITFIMFIYITYMQSSCRYYLHVAYVEN